MSNIFHLSPNYVDLKKQRLVCTVWTHSNYLWPLCQMKIEVTHFQPVSSSKLCPVMYPKVLPGGSVTNTPTSPSSFLSLSLSSFFRANLFLIMSSNLSSSCRYYNAGWRFWSTRQWAHLWTIGGMAIDIQDQVSMEVHTKMARRINRKKRGELGTLKGGPSGYVSEGRILTWSAEMDQVIAILYLWRKLENIIGWL